MEAKLTNFTKSLDNFESAIRRNKTFLQESQHVKFSANIRKRYDKNNKMLIMSIKNVINTLYTFVKCLERDFEVSDNLTVNYSPFENLQTCELYQINLEEDFKLKLIKVSVIFYYRARKKPTIDERNGHLAIRSVMQLFN